MEIIEPEKGKSEKEDINLNQISQNQIKTSNSVTDSSYSISVSLSILLIRERVIEAFKACEYSLWIAVMTRPGRRMW